LTLRAFDGLVTFFGSLHAMRAEKVLAKNGFEAELIPGPREISPHCGVALSFWYADAERIRPLLAAKKVEIDAIHRYQASALSTILAAER
jgi:hypothetical protein